MSVLVDSSVWIPYFRHAADADVLEMLIDENLMVINKFILAKRIPALHLRKFHALIALLREITRQPMNIDWHDIVSMQTLSLKKGINGIRRLYG